MFVLGAGVKGGGCSGRWPGLDSAARFEGRDLAVTTDFRDLFGEVVAGHLGAGPLDQIFPGYSPAAGGSPGVFPG